MVGVVLRELLDKGIPFVALFDVQNAGEDEAPSYVRKDDAWKDGLPLSFHGPEAFRDAEVTDTRFSFQVSLTQRYGVNAYFNFRLSSVGMVSAEGFQFVQVGARPAVIEDDDGAPLPAALQPPTAKEQAAERRRRSGLRICR